MKAAEEVVNAEHRYGSDRIKPQILLKIPSFKIISRHICRCLYYEYVLSLSLAHSREFSYEKLVNIL